MSFPAQSFSAEEPLPTPAPTKNARVLEEILRCTAGAQEAVLLQKSVKCVPYQKGIDVLNNDTPEMPMKVDFADACGHTEEDWRTLPGNAIKLLAKQPLRIDPQGIRLVGAIFCDTVDLIGLELPYSLVLDRSVFQHGIQGRSFRTHGDFSLDGSLVFDELFLARAHVDGSVFASSSLINRMRLLDTEVRGSLLFRKTQIFDLAAFDTIVLSGELSLRDSRFPYLLIQFSKIGGVLDLTRSQARCSYHVRKSEIGDIVAVDSGFGITESSPPDMSYDWKPSFPAPEARSDSSNNQNKFIYGRYCDRSVISFSPGSFLISDTRVKSSLCLRSFHWLEGSSNSNPNSFITFSDVNVGTAASIDLGADAQSPGISKRMAHKFEIMGFETGSFFFNFSEARNQPYSLSLSGLKFEHVYATAKNACDYDPDFAASDKAKAGAPNVRQGNDPDPASHSRLPLVEEVMTWLGGNSLATTQPFAAFVDVFQKHGEDADAKALRIAKANTELCLKAQRVFGSFSDWICGGRKEPAAGSQSNDSRSSIARAIGWGNDLASVVFGAVLWLIADNGYHPEKVGWFVVIFICVFFVYFWLALGTIGLLPKDKTIILPIGTVFLFDRLLPAYQIREDHYNIAQFFKRVPKKGAPYPDIKTMRYFGKDFSVIATTEAERLQIERSLDVLKIVGLVLAVFLVAAVNAIVSR
jgi:hypothetical protein